MIAIGRDANKGAAVEAELVAASGGAGSFVQADLALVAEAQRVVAVLRGRLTNLDALILSAGVIEFQAATTAEGLDRSFVINFLHKLVIAEGVKPLLSKAAGRVVLVAAAIPRLLGPDWRNFEGPRIYAGLRDTGRLHVASLALVQSLAAEWRADGIDVTAIHPGQVDTGIYRDFSRWPWKALKPIMGITRVSVDRPAALLSWLAVSPEAKGQSGNFFPSVKNFSKSRVLARDDESVARVMKTARHVIVGVAAPPP